VRDRKTERWRNETDGESGRDREKETCQQGLAMSIALDLIVNYFNT